MGLAVRRCSAGSSVKWRFDGPVALVVVDMTGLAEVGEVRDIGVSAVLVVLDVVGVAVFGVGGAGNAAAVADGQDDSLCFCCAADPA